MNMTNKHYRTWLLLAVLVLAGSAVVFKIAQAHTIIGGATVPTTFTTAAIIAPGGALAVPVPVLPHDLRIVVAVEPNAAEPINSPEHGVGTLDLIRNGAKVSFTGIDGAGAVVSGRNLTFAGGSPLRANASGTVRLHIPAAGPLLVRNTGAAPRRVHVRWIH
jgi:hypothetical protein